MLTQEQLRDMVTYHPESGLFTWTDGCNRKSVRGKIAGSINNLGYVKIKTGGKSYAAHRLAFLYMTGQWPPDEVDHINRVRDDNRWVNLRLVTLPENAQNKSLYKTNISGTPGITWHATHNRWQVKYDGRYVGIFKTIREAKSKLREVMDGPEQQPTIE